MIVYVGLKALHLLCAVVWVGGMFFALIVLRPQFKDQVQPEEIINWSRESMAAYKVPRIVEFVELLPKSGTGKIMWRHLQEQEAARRLSTSTI